MRKEERIEPFLEELGKIWKENCSDWRFMQLICNLQSAYRNDMFYLEEDTFLQYLKEYFKGE